MSATARGRTHSARHFAVGLAGYCAFINLYSPQSILPLLSEEFHASAVEVSTIITVSTLAVALTAPFTGAVADVLGRKRVIVAAMFAAVSASAFAASHTGAKGDKMEKKADKKAAKKKAEDKK